MSGIFLEGTKEILDGNDHDIIKRFGVTDPRGIYNQCVMVKGFDKPLRERAEMLIFRGNKLLVDTKRKNNFHYENFPGGGLDKGESAKNAAIRECKEEVRINVKNVIDANKYIRIVDEPHKWVKESIPEKDWWYGYYTYVFIGEYDSKYKGNIDEEDKDDLIKRSMFMNIKDVYNKLKWYHKIAVDLYMKK